MAGPQKNNTMPKLLSLFICILIFFPFEAVADTWEKEQAAVISAQECLGLIDADKYLESWNEAADLFRNSISQEQWAKTLQAVRKPLGKLVERKVSTKTFQTSLPGAPDGEYVVIQFETVFKNKKTAIETVTPMMGKDGQWRVSGYFIN
jgi:hypothetical protein